MGASPYISLFLSLLAGILKAQRLHKRFRIQNIARPRGGFLAVEQPDAGVFDQGKVFLHRRAMDAMDSFARFNDGHGGQDRARRRFRPLP